MKTCTVCGRRSPDDAARCPYDGGALAASPPDDTLVRARPAEPVAPPRFTVEDISRPAVPAAPRQLAPRPAAERPIWPAAVAIAVAATVGVSALVYYLYAQRTREVDAINAQVSDARVAVADAKARIESLPIENPLRQKIITLDKWDRELQGFQLSQERSIEVAARARDILREAEQISDAARGAGATMTVKPVVPPATPATSDEPPPPTASTPAAEPEPAEPGATSPGPDEPPPAETLPKPDSSEPKPPAPSPGANTNSAAPGGHPLPPPPSPPPPSGNTPRQDNSNKGGS